MAIAKSPQVVSNTSGMRSGPSCCIYDVGQACKFVSSCKRAWLRRDQLVGALTYRYKKQSNEHTHCAVVSCHHVADVE